MKAKWIAAVVPCAMGIVSLTATDAHAWKPITHVALAEMARQDAIDDGKVTIYKVNGETITTEKLGDFDVDPNILSALRNNPSQFRAGVLGPDAYPDIMTGQQVIHPDVTPHHGSTTWLQYIFDSSRTSSNAVKAFVAGFLSHAAGDMMAHTMVNNYAGGHFELGPNAARHLIFEGYMAKKGPMPGSYSASIDGVHDFIYRKLVDGSNNSSVGRLFRSSTGGTSLSIPAIYSNMRDGLQRDVDWWNRQSTAYRYTSPIQAAKVEYKRRWIRDIETGLRAWPAYSHRIAVALMFKPGGHADVDTAKTVASEYMRNHLLSMSGAPDALGSIANAAAAVSEFLSGLAAPIRNAIDALKRNMLDYLCVKAFGKTSEELRGWLTSPERYFDQVMGRPYGRAETVTLSQVHNNIMKLNGASTWDYRKVPAAYNTVVMTKLSFLAPSEITRLIRAAGGTANMPYNNVMFGGALRMLDGHGQWNKHRGNALVEANVWSKVMMPVRGERNP